MLLFMDLLFSKRILMHLSAFLKAIINLYDNVNAFPHFIRNSTYRVDVFLFLSFHLVISSNFIYLFLKHFFDCLFCKLRTLYVYTKYMYICAHDQRRIKIHVIIPPVISRIPLQIFKYDNTSVQSVTEEGSGAMHSLDKWVYNIK